MRPAGCNDSNATRAEIPRRVKGLVAARVLLYARRRPIDHVIGHRIGLHRRLSATCGTGSANDRKTTDEYTERAHFHLHRKKPDAIFPVGIYPHRAG